MSLETALKDGIRVLDLLTALLPLDAQQRQVVLAKSDHGITREGSEVLKGLAPTLFLQSSPRSWWN